MSSWPKGLFKQRVISDPWELTLSMSFRAVSSPSWVLCLMSTIVSRLFSVAILPEWVWGQKFAKHARMMREFSGKVFQAPWDRARQDIVCSSSYLPHSTEKRMQARGVSHPNSMAELLSASYTESNELSDADEYSIKAILSMAYSGKFFAALLSKHSLPDPDP
jgi:hypothetical protein